MSKKKTYSTDLFILTGEWKDYRGQNILKFIGISKELGPVEINITNNKPVMFVRSDSELPPLNNLYTRKRVEMKTFDGDPVDALYFNGEMDLRKADTELSEKEIKTYEADIDPQKRFLMEKGISAQIRVTGEMNKSGLLCSFTNPEIEPCGVNPDFKIASLDIETGSNNNLLYSVAVHLTTKSAEDKKVFLVDPEENEHDDFISTFPDEKTLLTGFLKWFNEVDPDIIIGWHVIGFDLMFLERKCKEYFIPFDLARGKGLTTLRERKPSGNFAFISGRVVIDGPVGLRSSFFSFEDYKLETVAQELLGTGKTITSEENKVEEIERLFAKDKQKLAEYNLTDAVLVTEIFNKTGLIELSVRRAQISGLLMDQLGMMTAAFDHFYLPKLHKEGFVAPNVKDLKPTEHAAGGYVLDPVPGIYDDVIVLDFKSLYPSIIQTFKIDPLSRLLSDSDTIKTPKGFKFSRTKHILPDFITELMEMRNSAKKKKDKQLSQAIKILMNSFYGVMGSYGCRFYHPDLPTAITGTGQWLLLESKKFLEERGYEVLYGDTDSLFAKLPENESSEFEKNGKIIANKLNIYWKKRIKDEFELGSFLEAEFEKYYRKFILTPARGTETGAKKRYAGMLVSNGEEKIEFVGMESVRSDWTRLAKDFQLELYTRIFNEEEIEKWMKDIVKGVKEGEFDDKLIYKKRLRKEVEEYTKNIPPHVKAAKQLNEPGDTIYYVITERGPIPVELKHNDIDYQHYIEKQLKPIADSVLSLLNQSFDSIVESDQLSFF